MAGEPQKPYGYGVEDVTYKPKAFSPFAGLGVLEATQAAEYNARNAIQAYNQDLYDNEGRAQQRAVRTVGQPYRLKTADWQGQADVGNAQANKNVGAFRAMYTGSNTDTLDPLITQEFVRPEIGEGNIPTGRLTSAAGVLPDNAHPERSALQTAGLYGLGYEAPYLMPSDPGPVAAPAAPAAAPQQVGAGGNQAPLPLTMDSPANSVLYNDFAPRADVTRGQLDSVRDKNLELQGLHAAAREKLTAALAQQSQFSSMGGDRFTIHANADAVRQAQSELDSLTEQLTTSTKTLTSMGTRPSAGLASPAAFNNYGLPAEIAQGQQAPGSGVFRSGMAPGSQLDPNPSMAPGATVAVPPSAMPASKVPGFTKLTNLYQHPSIAAIAPPGGAEYAGVFGALESDFESDAKAGGSSAYGFTQFTDDTFNAVAAKFPWGKGKSLEQLNALRKDPQYQAIAEAQLRKENEARLVILANKHPSLKINPMDPFHLYAMHHFNPEVAEKMIVAFSKSKHTPIISLFPKTGKNSWATVYGANKYLAPKSNNYQSLTIGQLYSNWINRAKSAGFYGGHGPRVGGGGNMYGVAR